MAERLICEDAFRSTSWEDVVCIKCKRNFTLWANGGELDGTACCGITYDARSKGYEIVAIAEDAAALVAP